MLPGVLKYDERKCVGKIGWLRNLTSAKCTVPLKEWMAASIMVPLKERINQSFLEINILLLTAERIAQTIDG